MSKVKVGDKIPSATLTHMTSDGPAPITTDEIFNGKKVVLFAVPGAFTPTCSAEHLPGFVKHAEELSSKGVDTIVCMAVNDVFVMDAWGRDQSVGDKILMVADGNAEFTQKLGLDLDASGFGMGTRSQRFSLIAEDGEILELNIEEGGAFEKSSAEVALSQLG